MPRQRITDLQLTALRQYHPNRATSGPKGQRFETVVRCLAEDAKRVRSLIRASERSGGTISKRNAGRLAKKLKRQAGRRRCRSLASRADMRWLRRRLFSQLWRRVTKYRGRVTTFTVIKRGWEFTPQNLDDADLAKLLRGFLSDLNRRGAGKASGWLIAFIHGEFETPGGIYRLHLHGVAAGGMIGVVDGLRKGRKYKHRAGDAVRCRVRIDRKPLRHLPHPLTYCFKSYWPWKHVILGANGKRRTRQHKRIPEPYHSQVLSFLDRHHPSEFVILKHLRVVAGQLERTRR